MQGASPHRSEADRAAVSDDQWRRAVRSKRTLRDRRSTPQPVRPLPSRSNPRATPFSRSRGQFHSSRPHQTSSAASCNVIEVTSQSRQGSRVLRLVIACDHHESYHTPLRFTHPTNDPLDHSFRSFPTRHARRSPVPVKRQFFIHQTNDHRSIVRTIETSFTTTRHPRRAPRGTPTPGRGPPPPHPLLPPQFPRRIRPSD